MIYTSKIHKGMIIIHTQIRKDKSDAHKHASPDICSITTIRLNQIFNCHVRKSIRFCIYFLFGSISDLSLLLLI